MDIFRLRVLRIREHKIFDEINVDLSESTDTSLSPYFTLIIGPNGTGKSLILKLLIDIFRLAYEKKNSLNITEYPSGKYYLEYFINNSTYVITNRLGQEFANTSDNISDQKNEKGIRFFKNGANEIASEEIEIPTSILALSIMLTDRYPVLKDNSVYPIYKYLGVRRDANTAGTRSYIRRTIDYIFQALNRESFREDLKLLLSFLGLEESFYVSYYPRYKSIFFTGKLTQENFEDFFLNNSNYLKRQTEPWSVRNFQSLKSREPEIIERLANVLNFLTKNLVPEYEGSRSVYFEFDIFSNEKEVIEVFTLLPYLNYLDVISFPVIMLKKMNRYFDMEESSSGEYHFISTIIGLLATISENSLVLIDEPEISLHPNWQMKYIGFLNELFKRYSSSQFVICTHSNFLVSDLKPENSTIVSLTKTRNNTEKKNPETIAAKQIKYSTYGWSAEEVLYQVFNVRSSRNSYLEYDLTKMVSMVNRNSTDFVEIRRILNKIEGLILNEADPLIIIREKVQKYLNNQNA